MPDASLFRPDGDRDIEAGGADRNDLPSDLLAEASSIKTHVTDKIVTHSFRHAILRQSPVRRRMFLDGMKHCMKLGRLIRHLDPDPGARRNAARRMLVSYAEEKYSEEAGDGRRQTTHALSQALPVRRH